MERPIVGFNVIKHLGHGSDCKGLSNKLHLALPGSKTSYAGTVATILLNDQETIGSVKTGKQNIIVPKNSSTFVKCLVHSGVMDHKQQPANFVPNVENQWEEGLELKEE